MTITETKIRGLEVRIDEHKIKILDAFQIKDRKKMKMIYLILLKVMYLVLQSYPINMGESQILMMI